MPGMETALGPYYNITSGGRMAIEESRRRALGYPAISPAAVAAGRYGELSSYLESGQRQQQLNLQKEQLESQKGFTEREVTLKEEAQAQKKKESQTTMAATGAGAGAAVGAAAAGLATAATGTTAASTIVGALGYGISASWLGPVGLVVGGILGYVLGGK